MYVIALRPDLLPLPTEAAMIKHEAALVGDNHCSVKTVNAVGFLCLECSGKGGKCKHQGSTVCPKENHTQSEGQSTEHCMCLSRTSPSFLTGRTR